MQVRDSNLEGNEKGIMGPMRSIVGRRARVWGDMKDELAIYWSPWNQYSTRTMGQGFESFGGRPEATTSAAALSQRDDWEPGSEKTVCDRSGRL